MSRFAGSLGLGLATALWLFSPAARSEDPLEPAAVEDLPPAPDPAPLEPLTAARRTAHNALYLELGGNALIYSVNYERFLGDEFSVRAGFGYLSVDTPSFGLGGASASLLMVPVLVNYLGVGGLSHKLELGFGLTNVYASAEVDSGGTVQEWDSGLTFAPTSSVAYRYAPPDGGINFKVGFAPTLTPIGVLPMLSVAGGLVF